MTLSVFDPGDFWKHAGNVSQVVAYVVATALLLKSGLFIWKRGLKPLIEACKVIYVAAHTSIENHQVLTSIALEFRNNHGSSLRDAVDRIEQKADQAATRAISAAEIASKAVKRADEVHDLVVNLGCITHQKTGACEHLS